MNMTNEKDRLNSYGPGHCNLRFRSKDTCARYFFLPSAESQAHSHSRSWFQVVWRSRYMSVKKCQQRFATRLGRVRPSAVKLLHALAPLADEGVWKIMEVAGHKPDFVGDRPLWSAPTARSAPGCRLLFFIFDVIFWARGSCRVSRFMLRPPPPPRPLAPPSPHKQIQPSFHSCSRCFCGTFKNNRLSHRNEVSQTWALNKHQFMHSRNFLQRDPNLHHCKKRLPLVLPEQRQRLRPAAARRGGLR